MQTEIDPNPRNEILFELQVAIKVQKQKYLITLSHNSKHDMIFSDGLKQLASCGHL